MPFRPQGERLMMKDRRLAAQIRSLGLGSVSASFLPQPAPAKLQNSDSGAFWYPLVPSGTLWVVGNAGPARRFDLRPAARQDRPQ